MKPETLAFIKKEMAKFLIMYNNLAEYYCRNNSFPELKVVRVLLQNASFSGVKSVEYSHEKAVERLYQIEKLLLEMRSYYNHHDMIQMAYDELSCCIMGNIQSEVEDDDCKW